MSIGLPGHLRPQVIARAYTTAAHMTAGVAIISAFLIVASVQTERPDLILWPALTALVPISIALFYLQRTLTRFATITYLLVGAASIYWFSLTVMSEYPLSGTDAFVLSAVRIALLLVGGPGGIWQAILWSTIGLILSEGVIQLAALSAGTPVMLDGASLVTYALSSAMLIGIRWSLRRSRVAQPILHRAARDAELAEVRFGIESRAAAVMHDTVLGHLAAIAHAKDGPLPAVLQSQVHRDLAILLGEEWLSEHDPGGGAGRTDWQQSALLAAIEETRRLGLDVEVSGDLAAVGRLDPQRSQALGLAAQQALANVLRHAGTDHAEVVVYGSETDVSVMVIDDGRGFVVSETAPDRLGIRQSILRRVESAGGDVQLWSTPGRGTSVLLRMPAERERAVQS